MDDDDEDTPNGQEAQLFNLQMSYKKMSEEYENYKANTYDLLCKEKFAMKLFEIIHSLFILKIV